MGFTLALPTERAGPPRLVLLATPFSGNVLRAEIQIGEAWRGEVQLAANAPAEIALPDSISGDEITVVIRFPDADLSSPADRGQSEDTRTLVAFFRTIALVS